MFNKASNFQKYIQNRKGQGSMLFTVVASVLFATLVSSTTNWFLSMRNNVDDFDDKLEAMTIAMSEWQRLEHMSLEELEANRENYKNPYDVGEKFKVGITLGEQGFFAEGKCNSLTDSYAEETANCFKDTVMTVYDKNGTSMYTTRSLPLSTGSNAFPEGTILPYTGDLAKIPRGWVLCDGTNGTPDLRGKFLEGTVTTTGEFKMAGLPNIIGYFAGGMDTGGYTYSGALYMAGHGLGISATFHGTDSDNNTIGFNASRSNPIYGRSDTVQPSSYTVFYIMKTNKDFHYEHTNGFVSPEYYTKEEVDKIIKDSKKDIENDVDINYLKKDSKEYVRNYSTTYTLGLGYNSEDNDYIHGYLDSEEKYFAIMQKEEEEKTSNADYTILPDGTIIQYGYIDTGYSTAGTYNLVFPIPFTKFVKTVLTQRHSANSSGYYAASIINGSVTLYGCKIGFREWGTVPNQIHFIAIGK